MATKQKLLRLSILQRKSSKLTDAEFHKHWTEHHAPIASSWLARNGIVGYTQYHTPPEIKQLAAGIADYAGAKLAEFDAHVEFMVHSVDDLLNALQDPEYPLKMQPDEGYMFERGSMVITLGYVETYVQDGKVVNIVDGKSTFAA
ncbi:EthD domain-containing protein [Xylogone sp. PMI_703]|nr:EthD domain-containing protein [Xylogone sp. PMI_703]